MPARSGDPERLQSQAPSQALAHRRARSAPRLACFTSGSASGSHTHMTQQMLNPTRANFAPGLPEPSIAIEKSRVTDRRPSVTRSSDTRQRDCCRRPLGRPASQVQLRSTSLPCSNCQSACRVPLSLAILPPPRDASWPIDVLPPHAQLHHSLSFLRRTATTGRTALPACRPCICLSETAMH